MFSLSKELSIEQISFKPIVAIDYNYVSDPESQTQYNDTHFFLKRSKNKNFNVNQNQSQEKQTDEWTVNLFAPNYAAVHIG